MLRALARPEAKLTGVDMGRAYAARRVYAWRPRELALDVADPVFIVPDEEWTGRLLTGAAAADSGRASLVDSHGVVALDPSNDHAGFRAADLIPLADALHHHAVARARFVSIHERPNGRALYQSALAAYLERSGEVAAPSLYREAIAFVDAMRTPSYGTLRQHRMDVDLAAIAATLAQAGFLERHVTPILHDAGARGSVVTFSTPDPMRIAERRSVLDLVLGGEPSHAMMDALFERNVDAAMKVALRSLEQAGRATLEARIGCYFAFNAGNPTRRHVLSVAMRYASVIRTVGVEAERASVDAYRRDANATHLTN